MKREDLVKDLRSATGSCEVAYYVYLFAREVEPDEDPRGYMIRFFTIAQLIDWALGNPTPYFMEPVGVQDKKVSVGTEITRRLRATDSPEAALEWAVDLAKQNGNFGKGAITSVFQLILMARENLLKEFPEDKGTPTDSPEE